MTTTHIAGKRVLMFCDDLQVDRRIIHEAESLIHAGCEVIVLARMGEGYPASAMDGPVRIERVDVATILQARATQAAIRKTLSSPEIPGAAAPLSLTMAEREFTGLFIGPDYGPLWMERWIMARGWLIRNAAKSFLWPPMRLNALRRYLPRAHWSIHYAIYLPTLVLTPRPLALRWHWRNFERKLARHIPALAKRLRRSFYIEDIKQAKALRAKVVNFDDLNLWEIALYERGCFLRPDVVQAHDLPQLRAACYIGEKLGIPVIYDAHELYPNISTLEPEQRTRLRAIESHFIRKATATITVNPLFAQKQAQDYKIAEPEVILNAIDLPPGFVRGEKKDLLRKAMGLGPNDKILLYQGWVTLHRSLDVMVLGLKDTPGHIHLAILGYGDDIAALKKLAREHGLAGRVHFLTPVPQREILDWVASADAGIIPYQAVDANSRMCSPNKLFEFIAAGLPIIANDLTYLQSVIGPNNFGVLHPLSKPADYAAAIRIMFASDEDRFRTSLLTRAEPYLWPAQEAVLLRIYDMVLSSWVKPPVTITQPEPITTLTPSPATSSNTLRIFHGPTNTSGIAGLMARTERALGLDSRSVCYPSRHYGFTSDITLEHTANGGEILDRIRRYADMFDVFVFHFGQSLANDTLADVPMLKAMGKTVIFYFHGCDIRQSKETIRKYEFSACKDCWPQRCSPNRDLALEMSSRYADAIWVSTPDLLEFVPGATLFPQPVDLERYQFRTPPPHKAGTKFKLVHAPSDPQLKGTRYLEEAVRVLQSEGTPLVLELLLDMSQEEIRSRLQAADLAVDQLLFGSYGVLGVELMATGVPLACFLRPDLIAHYPELPPVLNANQRTIAAVLREMIARQSEWPQMAQAGRAYAERYHDAKKIARQCAELYAQLRAKPSLAGAA